MRYCFCVLGQHYFEALYRISGDRFVSNHCEPTRYLIEFGPGKRHPAAVEGAAS